MPATDAGALSGISVMVTRPAHQAARLVSGIQACGGRVVQFPLLSIEPHNDPVSIEHLHHLARFQLLVFVSANAVEMAMPYLSQLPTLPEIAVIGSATAAKCRENGLKPDFVPDNADSESLLALARFASLAGERILIVRGVGGRDLLINTLRDRGAQVEIAELYTRREVTAPLPDEPGEVDIVTVTSTQALQQLAHLAARDQRRWIFEKPLLVLHPRIAGRTAELGFKLPPIIATQVNDEGMLVSLTEWASSRREPER